MSVWCHGGVRATPQLILIGWYVLHYGKWHNECMSWWAAQCESNPEAISQRWTFPACGVVCSNISKQNTKDKKTKTFSAYPRGEQLHWNKRVAILDGPALTLGRRPPTASTAVPLCVQLCQCSYEVGQVKNNMVRKCKQCGQKSVFYVMSPIVLPVATTITETASLLGTVENLSITAVQNLKYFRLQQIRTNQGEECKNRSWQKRNQDFQGKNLTQCPSLCSTILVM